MPAKTKKVKRRPGAKTADKIPVAFHPAINEAHIIGGNPDAHAILSALFKACGWKTYTHSPRRKKSSPSVVTHSHYEQGKKKSTK